MLGDIQSKGCCETRPEKLVICVPGAQANSSSMLSARNLSICKCDSASKTETLSVGNLFHNIKSASSRAAASHPLRIKCGNSLVLLLLPILRRIATIERLSASSITASTC